MTLVRFRKQYSDSEPRMAYELVSEQTDYNRQGELCYDVMLIGYVPVRKLEITNDPTDVSAIDIFVKLSNI